MRRTIRVASLTVIPLVLATTFFVFKPSAHQLILKTYFTNAMGLRPGAKVRLAGLDIGDVKAVNLRLENRQSPVEVVMGFSNPAKLMIPNDSAASLQTAGVLGETFVDIDTSNAIGPPVTENYVLKSKPIGTLNAGQVLDKFTNILSQQVDNLSKKIEDCVNKGVPGCDAKQPSPPATGSSR